MKVFFYFIQALNLFGTKIVDTSVVYLTDNVGADIAQDKFKDIIRTFHAGGNYFVRISFQSLSSDTIELVTPVVSNILDEQISLQLCLY